MKTSSVVGWRSAALLVADALADRSRIVRVTVAGQPLLIRTNTPDLEVAIDCLVHGEYERVESPDCHTIVDAGAHIGVASLYFARRFPGALIIAVEPERENYDLLVRNTAESPNIVAINSAIWSDSRPRQLRDRSTGSWGYTIAVSENPTIPMAQLVPCVTIESLMRDHGLAGIDILKMDVEGSEKAILEASNSWIDRVAVLTIELHDRITMGCSRAFYMATNDFERFETSGEKVTAFRH